MASQSASEISYLLLPVLAGLAGVWLGGWITVRGQREERRHALIVRKLDQFYSPMLGIRARLLAKGETRTKISSAAGTAWRELFSERLSPQQKLRIMESRSAAFDKIIEESNRQLIEELLPLYREMMELFTRHMWLAEPSTRRHFGELVAFLDTWERWLGGTLPNEVLRSLGETEDPLVELYKDLAMQLDLLTSKLQ